PYAFVRKMVRTMGCFRNLISSGFVEEAQVFGRVLIETRINFEYFLQLAAKDCNSAIGRVFDTIMLDKLKALHATNFRIGNRRVNRRRWAAIEAQIKKVYGDQIFKQLKQHGFSEMSLEARAIKTRNKPLYDLAYRLYSRSVHATDIIEQLKGISSTKAYTQREDAQFPAVLEAAVNCGIAINRAANQWLGDPLGLSKIERK